jgi:hypothetical protein
MKISPVGAELFHADGQTDGRPDRDMTKLIVDFRNFANASKKGHSWTIQLVSCMPMAEISDKGEIRSDRCLPVMKVDSWPI